MIRKIFYIAIFSDRDWNFEEDKELRGVLKVRPFNTINVPANNPCLWPCLWIDNLRRGQCQYQLWWWESSPPALLPRIDESFELSDSLYCKIKRVWEGRDIYAILEIIPPPETVVQPVFVTIRGKMPDYKKRKC